MIDPLSDSAFEDLADMGASDEDKKLRPRFFVDEVKDEAASKKEGRQIYKSVEMVEIKIPGDRDNVFVTRIKDGMDNDPRERFPAAYARFKRGEAVQVVGTPLRRWGLMEPAEARGYEDVGVMTVEQLAAMSDATCQQHRGSLADRQKARDFLEMAKGLAPVAEARAEAERLRSEIEALKEAIVSMGGTVPEAPAAAPRRRGRPPKAKPAESTEA